MSAGAGDPVGALAGALGHVSEAFTRAATTGAQVAEACALRRRTATPGADDDARHVPFADPDGRTVWVPEDEIVEWLAARRPESVSKAESAAALAIAWDVTSTPAAVTAIADWLADAAHALIGWTARCETAMRIERADASGSWYGLVDPAYVTHRTCLVELAGPLTELAGAHRAALAACGRFLDAADEIITG